jgi:hypothetical protein
MEECPICLEPMRIPYTMNCSHSLCACCARKCKKESNENCINIETTFKVYTKDDNPIKCPLCRCVEPKMTVDEFKEYDPETYLTWMNLELNCDEWGWSTYDEPVKQKQIHYYQSKLRIPKRVVWKVKPKSIKFNKKI